MTWIGIDFGAKRIGIATSASGELAEPHSVVARRGEIAEVVGHIASLAEELGAHTIVVGIPVGGRVAPSDNLRHYSEFAELLRQKTPCIVVLWDEGYSTVEAASLLRETGRRRRDEKARIDMLAATVILQSYLDARPGRPS